MYQQNNKLKCAVAPAACLQSILLCTNAKMFPLGSAGFLNFPVPMEHYEGSRSDPKQHAYGCAMALHFHTSAQISENTSTPQQEGGWVQGGSSGSAGA